MISHDDIKLIEDIFSGQTREEIVKGLDFIGSGLYKQVYAIMDLPLVVKFPHENNKPGYSDLSFEYEWAVYLTLVRNGDSHLFPDTIWGELDDGTPFMIQERCDYVTALSGDDYMDIVHYLNDFGLVDLYSNNMGITADGRTVTIDWGHTYPYSETPAFEILNKLRNRKSLAA